MPRPGLLLALLALISVPFVGSHAQDDGIVISIDGAVIPGDPITEGGLPIEGFDCDDIYWLDGQPQYQNRAAVIPFTVDVTAPYRFFISNGIRTPLPEPEGELTLEEQIELENSFPRPYVMLYRRVFDINHTTAYCLWAARDERTPYFAMTLEPDTEYFLVVSYEGNLPEWSFSFHVTVERVAGSRHHFCYAETDYVCTEPPLWQ